MFFFIFFINLKKVRVFKFPPQIPNILHIFIFRNLKFFHFKKSCFPILSRNFKICSHFQILFWNLEECSRLKQIFMIFRKCSYFPKKNLKKNYCFLYQFTISTNVHEFQNLILISKNVRNFKKYSCFKKCSCFRNLFTILKIVRVSKNVQVFQKICELL